MEMVETELLLHQAQARLEPLALLELLLSNTQCQLLQSQHQLPD
jgi:hypothetical protein